MKTAGYYFCLFLASFVIVGGARAQDVAVAEKSDKARANGQRSLEKSDYTMAIRAFNEALRLDPKSAKAYIGLASAYARTGQNDKAIADFTAALHLEQDSAEAFYGRAMAYAKKGDSKKAISDFTSALRLGWKSAVVYYNRGVAYLHSRQYDNAIADFTEAANGDSKYGPTYYNRGWAYDEKGDREKAIADYTVAIRLNPRYLDAYCNRAAAYQRKHDFNNAVTDYTAVLKLDRNSPQAYRNRGAAYDDMGECDKAIADYSDAIRLDPKDVHALVNRGVAYSSKGEYDKAILDYDNAIRLEPKNPIGYGNRGLAYENKKEHGKALADLDAALGLRAQDFLYREIRGMIRLRCGDYHGGTTDLNSAIALDPHDPAARFEKWEKATLAPNALDYGKEQVKRMLADRPAMAIHGDRASVLLEWAARKFAGEDLRQIIVWDEAAPASADAENVIPTVDQVGRIRILKAYRDGDKKGKERPFEYLWASAVFELYNITSARDFLRADEDAAAGRLTKDEYIATYDEIESRAADKTRAFYVHVFLPWAAARHIPTDPKLWFVGARSNRHENPMLQCTAKGSSRWKAYALAYDLQVLGGLLDRGETDKAVALATNMLKRAATNGEKAGIYIQRGWDYYKREADLDRALADFNEAVRLAPKNADAYISRGSAYERKHDCDKAIADYDEAIRLDPNDAEGYRRRGDTLIEKYFVRGKIAAEPAKKAIADYSTAIRLNPASERAYRTRGWAFGATGDFDKEIADENEAIRLDPKDADAFVNRSWAYDAKGEEAEAKKDSEEADRLKHAAPTQRK